MGRVPSCDLFLAQINYVDHDIRIVVCDERGSWTTYKIKSAIEPSLNRQKLYVFHSPNWKSLTNETGSYEADTVNLWVGWLDIRVHMSSLEPRPREVTFHIAIRAIGT